MKHLTVAATLLVVLVGCSNSNQATRDDIRDLQDELMGIRQSIETIYKEVAGSQIRLESMRGELSQMRQFEQNYHSDAPSLRTTLLDSATLFSIPPQYRRTNANDAPPRSNLGDETSSDSNPKVGTTRSGAIIYEGPRGGHYHYSKTGHKVYERKKK